MWCGALPSVHDDVFLRGGGIGINGYLLFQLLDPEEGQTVKQLCAQAHLKPATARTALRRMSEAGLATREEGLWYRVPAPDFELAARTIGTLGKGAAQTERLRREQEARDLMVRAWAETQRRKQTAG